MKCGNRESVGRSFLHHYFQAKDGDLEQSSCHFKDEGDRNLKMTKDNVYAENSLVEGEIRGVFSSISSDIQDEYLEDKLEANTLNDNPHIHRSFSKKNSLSIWIQKLLIRTDAHESFLVFQYLIVILCLVMI